MKNIGWVLGIVLVVILMLLFVGTAAGLLGWGGYGFMHPGMTLAPHASAGVGGYGMMGGWGTMGGWGFGMMGIGMLLTVLFWVLVIAGIAWLAVTLARGGTASVPRIEPGATAQMPLDILKLRYAKGEITKEQFEEMKRDLGV